MRLLRTALVAVLLGSFFSPALGLARTEPRTQPVAAQPLAAVPANAANTSKGQAGEAAQYQQREQQSQDLQNFKGGAVYVYFGSGVILALIIILLILL